MDVEGNIVTRDEEKAEMLTAAFASVFCSKAVVLMRAFSFSWTTSTIARSVGGTTQQDTGNAGDSWNALMTTSFYK